MFSLLKLYEINFMLLQKLQKQNKTSKLQKLGTKLETM